MESKVRGRRHKRPEAGQLTKAEKPMATGDTTVVQQNKKRKQPKVELTKNISSHNNNSPLPFSSKIHRPTTVDDALLSDSKYAEELQVQDVILLSLTEDYVTINHSTSEKEIGGPSQYLCAICADQRANHQMFVVPNCTHRYCQECIIKYVSTKLQGSKSKENVFFFTCPAGAECKGVLELDACRRFMPNHVVAMWEDVMCESLIVASQRFYCPFKDCSGLIVNDIDEQKVIIRESECPFCHRLFCAQCKVPWHSGYECEEFSKLGASDRGREDLMVYELAKKKKWQRCPRCKFIVEKVQGCLHISCRCGYHFCYRCGGPFDYATHGACKRPRR